MIKLNNRLALILSAIYLAIPASNTRADEISNPCIPKTVTESSLESQYARNDESFFYYTASLESGELSAFLIRTDSEGCRLLIEPDNLDVFLHDVIDFDAEKNIWLGNYQKAIQVVGGVQPFQELINDSYHPDATMFRSEAEVAALEDLGIDLPVQYNLVSGEEDTRELLSEFRESPLIFGERFINSLELADDYAVVKWYRSDAEQGLAFARKVSDAWEILGFVNTLSDEVNPDLLFEKFDIPLDVASKLLEAE